MTYILNRLLSIVLTLFLISVITFCVTTILPGDVATMIMGTQSNPVALAGLRKSLGLDDPLIVQYGRWIGGMLVGDWGHSLIFKSAISELLVQKIKASSLIVVMSMAIALGFMAARPLTIRATTLRGSGKAPNFSIVSSSIAAMTTPRGAGRAPAIEKRQSTVRYSILSRTEPSPSICLHPKNPPQRTAMSKNPQVVNALIDGLPRLIIGRSGRAAPGRGGPAIA